MSPEQVSGQRVDSRTDIWSLGVVLYAMLTGRQAFDGDSDLAIYRAILENEPPPPSSMRGDVPDDIDGVVDRLLTKERADRPQSAAEVLALLGAPVPESASREATEALDLPPPRPKRLWTGARAVVIGAVAALALVVTAVILMWPARPAPSFDSVAVLPFSNYTGDADLDALGDTIAAGLVNRLREVPDLGVVARSEVQGHRQQEEAPTELGRRLGVDLLLEGNLTRGRRGLSVTTSLVESREGRVVWSKEFIDSSGDMFALQETIGDRLVDVLKISASRGSSGRSSVDPVASFHAYDTYIEGQRALDEGTDPAGMTPAVEIFRQAIRLDADFALGHAGLSEALWLKGRRSGDEETIEEAVSAALNAQQLDPELPAGWVAMARIRRGSGEYQSAIDDLRRVLETHPNPENAHLELAESYERAGYLEDAEQWYRAACAVTPENWRCWNTLGAFLWSLGRYDEAGEAFSQASEVAPAGVMVPNENRAAVEISRGNFSAAVATYERIAGPITNSIVASNMGTAYYFSDRIDRLERAERYYRLAVDLAPGSDEIQRNLADVLLATGRSEEAKAHYGAALEIVRAELELEPDSSDLLLREAFYSARSGDCVGALASAGALRKDLPPAVDPHHRLAYVFSLCGAPDAAISILEEAVSLGLSPELLRQEDEFAPLRGHPGFEKLVTGAVRGR
jgi:TolB-like protein/tetratricopeptide (TPR) repeat protein